MLPRKTTCKVGILAALFFCSVTPIRTQVFDLDKDREQMVALDGLWRFHPGDDPRWADPDFDDSQWPLISSTKGWSDQGYKNMSGTAWYRARVHISRPEEPLSLYVPRILCSYEVYADGKLLGGMGSMPPHPVHYVTPIAVYGLPQPRNSEANALLLAIRVWHSPVVASWWSGGIQGGIRIGSSAAVEDRRASEIYRRAWSQTGAIFLGILELLAGLTALAFFLARRNEQEYVWFGVMILLGAAENFFLTSIRFHQIGIVNRDLIGIALDTGQQLARIFFYLRLLGSKRNWLFWVAIVSASLYFVLAVAEGLYLLTPPQLNVISALLFVPIAAWTLNLVIRRAGRRFPDARLLLVPILLDTLANLLGWVWVFGYQTGLYSVPGLDRLFSTWEWPFPFSLNNAVDASFLIAMQTILLLRFTRSRRHEEQLAGEFEAARVVQQVLIPEAISAVPGFGIQSVYKPFGEVGGDFFQVLSIRAGGVLVIIGDVSGKGMPAAMAVSLLVGTIRTLAHYTQNPGEILAAMNQRMLARSRGGFTTCLVIRVDTDGTLTIANAGHLSPYINGRELPIENGLPLGLVVGTAYPECTAQLENGATLTLITDGVVEARARNGELFGFERTDSIATLRAEHIANTAAAFGQEDDITVLTITRVAAGQESLVTRTLAVSPFTS